MPASKTSPKQPQRFKHGFKAEAERISLECRKELGLKDYSPLSAVALANHLKVKILTPTDIPGITDSILQELLYGEGRERWSAAIFSKNDKKYIIHNPTHSKYRQESDLMHELAHAIKKHPLHNLETALTNCIIPLRKYDEEQEAEAEWLGGCLQLPKSALFYYHHVLGKNKKEISASFNASEEMVRYRLSVTGVTRIKYSRKIS